jgi:hypothetical protein
LRAFTAVLISDTQSGSLHVAARILLCDRSGERLA